MDPMSSQLARLRADPAFARSAPFGVFVAALMLGSALAAASISIPWLVVARNLLVALVLVWLWPAYGELRSFSAVRPAQWLVAVVAGAGTFLLWIVFDQDWAVLSRGPGFAPTLTDGRIDWTMGALRMAGFALVVPVMEELFWRSFLLRWLEKHDFQSVRPAQVGLRAIVITAVLFALEHNQWFAAAIAGIVYSWIYVRSGNLWLPIAAHAATNAALGAWILATHNWKFW